MIDIVASWVYGIFGLAFLVGTMVWVVQRIKATQYHRIDEEKIMRFYLDFWGNEWGTGSKEEVEELKKLL